MGGVLRAMANSPVWEYDFNGAVRQYKYTLQYVLKVATCVYMRTLFYLGHSYIKFTTLSNSNLTLHGIAWCQYSFFAFPCDTLSRL